VAAAIVGSHLDALKEENITLRAELTQIQRQIATMNAMQADVSATPEALQQLVDERIKALMK
jgi:prefoldin subunit 5